MAKLTLDDIADVRAYERERDEFRRHIIALKKRRRIAVGPFVTVLFENRDTIRFQIQEMARAEKLLTDEQVEAELRTYNPLIPDAGELAATVFIELTSRDELMEWLPKLVGIERSLELVAGEGDAERRIRAEPDADHDQQLTRAEITPSVHYVHWRLDADEIAAVERGPVRLAVVHPAYRHDAVLDGTNTAELLSDLHGG